MITRILMFGLIVQALVASVQAEPAVFFRGKHLTYRHFVYGEVASCATTAGTINLGYAHGIQDGQVVGVLRRGGGNLLPVGLMRMTDVRPGESFGHYEGAFSLKKNDIVIVAAKDLHLWKGGTRQDQLAMKSLVHQDEYRYDTGEVSAELLNEVGRDDDLIARKSPPLHVNGDLYSVRRPFTPKAVIRGAFRLATGDLDGPVNTLSKEDVELSPNSATLSLEAGLAKFVSTSVEGKLTASDDSLRKLISELPGRPDIDEVMKEIRLANVQINALIRRR